MSLKNKSVLVTGGAGFIGSHLVDRIIKDNPEKIVVVDNMFLGKQSNLTEARKNFENMQLYIENASHYETMKKILEDEICDVVFNLAVIPLPASFTRPVFTVTENVNITLTMCELARNDLFKTLIHFSSSETYGSCLYAPMSEDHPLNGTTPYAASKSSSDHVVQSYYLTFGIDTSIIRPFNNYGPRQNEGGYAGVIPLTIKRILNNESPIIYGDGKQTRDYLYVTDTADAAIKIYNEHKTRGQILNIASGKEIEIEYLIQCIAKIMCYYGIILYEQERPGDIRRHIANIYRAENIIGFKPTVKFETGLERTIDWYYQKHLCG